MLKIENGKLRIKNFINGLFFSIFLFVPVWAEEEVVLDEASPISEYNVDGSMFQKITELEQEKLLLQLEKERGQLELDLDRLAAEKIKLQMEIETISGRAEAQQQALEAERLKLEKEKEALAKKTEIQDIKQETEDAKLSAKTDEKSAQTALSKKYKLIEIIGSGRQLQATLEDIASGQRKKAWAGKELDGYSIKEISLDDGIVFEKDGDIDTLNIGK